MFKNTFVMEVVLTVIDYTFLVLTLMLSLGVGLYYAIFKKQNTAKEYLHGGKNMNFIGISLSICASMISGTTIIAIPADIYYYGIQFGLQYCIVMVFISILNYFFVCPIFYKLQLTSVFTYLSLRFNTKVKNLASIGYTIALMFISSITTYMTALTVAQIIKIDVHVISAALCSICIIYSTFGGFKGIIWTDALQFLIMITSLGAICVISIQESGGIANVADIVMKSGRLFVEYVIKSLTSNTCYIKLTSFDIDLTKRDTFLSTFCGSFFQVGYVYMFSQGTTQRFISLKSYKEVKYTHLLSSSLWIIMNILSTLCGIVIVARYMFCDPLTTGKIKKQDQIMAYTVLEIGKRIPGFSGIFAASITSAGLSSVSTMYNSLSATLFTDFLRSVLPERIAKRYEVHILKLLVLMIGILSTCFIYIIPHLGSMLTALLTVGPINYGVVNSLFMAGVFMPYINAKGALFGGITTAVVFAWLTGVKQWYVLKGLLQSPKLPTYTNSCNFNIWNQTITSNSTPYILYEVPKVYKLSHYYISIVGLLVVVIVGFAISYLSKNETDKINDELLTPIVHYFRRRSEKRHHHYHPVNTVTAVTE